MVDEKKKWMMRINLLQARAGEKEEKCWRKERR
jgi:hypothetical protein